MANGITLVTGAAVVAGTVLYPLGTEKGNFSPSRTEAMVVQLAITASTAPTTLDVYFQHSLDGTNWDDFINLHATGNHISYAQWQRAYIVGAGTAPDDTAGVHTQSDGALTANSVLPGPVGDSWRVKVVTVGTSWTFTVTVRPITAGRS